MCIRFNLSLLKTDSDASGFLSMSVMAAEAPYRLPIVLDVNRLNSLLEARKLEAEDHVWSLREDPAYFAEQFREIQDHRQEMIPDVEGKPHPATRKLRENALWARVTFDMLLDAYANLETLTELHRQAQNLVSLHKRFEKITEATVETGLEYVVALVRFKYYLEQACKAPLDKLKVSVAASPPMRKFFVEPAKKSERVEPSLEKDIWALNQPMSNLFLGQSEETGQNSNSRSVQSKTKVKTKGEASQVSNETFDAQPDNASNPEATNDQPIFAVDARVLKVFRTLFFNPEVTSTPGSISWHDFLYAMASTGFQIEKLYGSVWQFSPTSLDVERGIHFHEPHPIGKIPFEVARRHG
ncbi:hypothetical protein FAVG1_11322 [Fusarium avenaceum]|nr:hypothetical protein FAVG1_11322 [Fusarium avenaceum]